jgi:tripartite-type tricarboxylate transporter receptor subunit TctC
MNILRDRRRALLVACVVAVASPVVRHSAAQAQSFPSKPIRLIVPFGAGGIADLTARTIGERMGATLGQPIVVENRPGAGGVVAAELVAKAEPDGHTLLLMSNANAVSAGLFKSLPYDTLRDFAPIGVAGTFDLAIGAPANAKFRTLAEMLAFAKANPGKLNIGTINVGSTQHLSAELFKSTAGIDAQVVPFNGTPAIISALRGGQIETSHSRSSGRFSRRSNRAAYARSR